MMDLGSGIICASSEEYSYDVLVFSRKVIDRGKLFGSTRRSYYYADGGSGDAKKLPDDDVLWIIQSSLQRPRQDE